MISLLLNLLLLVSGFSCVAAGVPFSRGLPTSSASVSLFGIRGGGLFGGKDDKKWVRIEGLFFLSLCLSFWVQQLYSGYFNSIVVLSQVSVAAVLTLALSLFLTVATVSMLRRFASLFSLTLTLNLCYIRLPKPKKNARHKRKRWKWRGKLWGLNLRYLYCNGQQA